MRAGASQARRRGLPWLATVAVLHGCGGPDTLGGAGGASGDGDPAQGFPMQVVLDGILDEWAEIPPVVEDEDDPGADPLIDLEALSLADDPAWLFLQLDVGEALNLQAMPGTILLMVDADGDPSTGGAVEGMEGVEFAVELSPRRDAGPGGYGAGFRLRLPDGSTRTPYDAGFAGLPTYAAERFELRLSRRPRGGLPPLGPTIRLGLVARAESVDTTAASGRTVEVDRLPVTRYRFATPAGPDPFTPDLGRLAPPTGGAFRVAAWNVGSETFRDRAAFASALGLVRPDVILLDEVYEGISPEELSSFFGDPALDSLGRWSFVISRGGGRQKTVVAARDRAVRQDPGMVDVRYAPEDLEALQGRTPEAFHGALEVEARVGMSATGAWVEVDPEGAPGREVLFVPVDLQSAGWNGSPQDGLRLVQAWTLVAHLRQATRAVGATTEPVPAPDSRRAAVVVAGDLNLVGGAAPLDALLTGAADAVGPLVPAVLPRLDEAIWATWLSERQAVFGPGRLDFALYSQETLEQVGGFVLGSVGLDEGQLAALGTDRAGVAQLEEDHLPVIVDLRLRGGGSR